MTKLPTSLLSGLKRKWMLPLVAIAGLLITVLVVKLQPQMTHDIQRSAAVPVKVISVDQHSLRPAIVGFGTAQPDLLLRAKAEATGRITYIHPDLKKGAVLPKDTLVLSIDDKDYRLALKQAEADLLAANASLKEMQLTIENNRLELKLANEKFKVRNKELQRLIQLRKTDTVSQSRLDQERQTLLAQQQEVQKLENKRTTLPSELEVLKAKIDISQAKLEQSQRDLARTQVFLPFSGRISAVYAEKDQFVSKGADMFDAVGLDKITINAQFPIDQFSRFAAEFDKTKLDFLTQSNVPAMTQVLEALGLKASVEVAGSQFKSWQAKVERFSDNLDLHSRTIGVIVSVTGSYQQVEPGVRPPLLEGMYMKVTLQGQPTDYLVLPRFALHQQQIFKVSEDDKLQRISTKEMLLQDGLALLKADDNTDIAAGDRIIVSDVFPAFNGLSVAPQPAPDTAQQLLDWVEAAQ